MVKIIITMNPQSLRPLLTCSSVFRSPNSSKKAVSEGNCDGSRKLSKLKSSSTEFCKGVPVSSTLCSCTKEHCIMSGGGLPTQYVLAGKWNQGILCSMWAILFCFHEKTGVNISWEYSQKRDQPSFHITNSSSNFMLMKATIHSFIHSILLSAFLPHIGHCAKTIMLKGHHLWCHIIQGPRNKPEHLTLPDHKWHGI